MKQKKNLRYNFYAKLDKIDFEFTHYRNAWKLFEAKKEYTFGDQIRLISSYLLILFIKTIIGLFDLGEKLFSVFTVEKDEKQKS